MFLLSSYQIYNVDKRIQEDNLQHLALFSEFARMANANKNDSDENEEADLKKSDEETNDSKSNEVDKEVTQKAMNIRNKLLESLDILIFLGRSSAATQKSIGLLLTSESLYFVFYKNIKVENIYF